MNTIIRVIHVNKRLEWEVRSDVVSWTSAIGLILRIFSYVSLESFGKGKLEYA